MFLGLKTAISGTISGSCNQRCAYPYAEHSVAYMTDEQPLES